MHEGWRLRCKGNICTAGTGKSAAFYFVLGERRILRIICTLTSCLYQVYFGFSHCPDICPEELDKMSRMIDLVASASQNRISTLSFNDPSSKSQPLLPLFITCDPARDTPAVLKSYLAEFHPGLVGLTGTWDQVKDVCKKYRVYFSTPPNVKPGMDYLVDHSIYFYLMDPEGDFVEAIGRQHSAEGAAKIIVEHMSDWKGVVKR